MENFAYRNLIAYQKGKEVVMQTYRLLKKFPREEQYALCDQLRRASTSITSNIAEGMTHHSSKDRQESGIRGTRTFIHNILTNCRVPPCKA